MADRTAPLTVDRLDQALEWLNKSFDAGRLAHAYVVVGSTTGVGQELVLNFVSRIIETDIGNLRTHPDLHWVEPKKKSRIIGVDQMRAAQKQMMQTSFAGGWKVCVLQAADRLGDSAANAFLKVLEEPPGKSMFFLLTDKPEALLATVASRCQRINLENHGDELKEPWLGRVLGILASSTIGPGLSRLALGSGILEVLDEMSSEIAEREEELRVEGEEQEAVDARSSARFREARSALLRALQTWHRDVLLCVCGTSGELLHFTDYADVIRSQAEATDYRSVCSRIDAIEEMERRLHENIDQASVVALGAARLSIEC